VASVVGASGGRCDGGRDVDSAIGSGVASGLKRPLLKRLLDGRDYWDNQWIQYLMRPRAVAGVSIDKWR
jgi:hypothetical protein